MRISLGQIIVLLLILFLLFGDLNIAKKQIQNFSKQINKLFQKNKK